MSNRFVMPNEQVFLADGSGVGSGWKLYFYSTGTTTAKDTFSDADLTTANTNPVVADSSGRFGNIFLESGTYKVVLKDDSDVQQWTADPVTGGFGSSGDINTKTAAYTVTIGDATKIIFCDASSAAFTVTLPAAATAGNGFEVTIKKLDTGSNTVTIDGNGSETIDAKTTHVLYTPRSSVTIRSTGSNWVIVSSHPGIQLSFTPVFADASSGGNESATALTGRLTLSGTIARAYIVGANIDTTGLTGANDAFITGLPITSAAIVQIGIARLASTAFATQVLAAIPASTTYITFSEMATGAALDNLTVAEFTDDTADFIIQIDYEIA